MKFIRSLLFYITFLIFTVCYIPAFVLAGFFIKTDAFSRYIMRSWMHGFIRIAKKILHIDYTLKNFDLIKHRTSPIIIAPKHQSMWETFLICSELGENMRIVLKKQILNYPLISRLIKNTHGIAIDHKNTLQSLRTLLEEGGKAINNGENLCIFPEGERVKAGENGTYHSGLFFIYKKLNIPVATIALNAGVFWPTKQFAKIPGTITVEVTGIIDPGLTKKEFDEHLHQLIEQPSQKMLNL
ncbi:MAG: 1-acyl-sn-glycerol-3-phosphate acyltransferase [Alphaproteobacteria bacterium]|nr:MAG: 1-acyl-sn-glycerol-3-phosphate acyltransferase [Alphaproteobacteria bacterium]